MKPLPPFATAILLAGGSGRRMGDATTDKILLPICGKPILGYSIDSFAKCESVDSVIIVYRDDTQKQSIEPLIPREGINRIEWAKGGQKRQDSVWAGLSQVDPECEVVLIHDGARPFIDPTTIDAVANAARISGAASVARPLTDTVKQTESLDNGYILKTIDRTNLWAMETPQGFKSSILMEAYRNTIESGELITDDLSAIEASKTPVSLIKTDVLNPKLTTARDIPLFEFLFNHLKCR